MVRRKNDIQTIGDPMTGHSARISNPAETRAHLDGMPLAYNLLQYKPLVSRFKKTQLDSFLPDPDLMPQFVSLDASDAE